MTAKNLRDFSQIYVLKFTEDTFDLVEFYKAANRFEYEWLQENKHCAICDKKLPDHDPDPVAFHYICSEHRGYAQTFQVDVQRKKLGFPQIRNTPNFYGDEN